jgi:hypothetical protein
LALRAVKTKGPVFSLYIREHSPQVAAWEKEEPVWCGEVAMEEEHGQV